MKTLSMAVRHSSESVEHYTPELIVLAARTTLEHIDLDPASCAFANELVRATKWYGSLNNGYQLEWQGHVFLNPPGGLSDNQERMVKPKCRKEGTCGLPPNHTHEGVESSAKKWWFKLAREFVAGRAKNAIFVGFSLELLQTTQNNRPGRLAIPLDFPICIPHSRVAYDRNVDGVRVEGASPPHASFIVCVSDSPHVIRRFKEAFGKIGKVVP